MACVLVKKLAIKVIKVVKRQEKSLWDISYCAKIVLKAEQKYED